MPFYEKGDVRIRYEEAGSGFPLLLIAGGGLDSTISYFTGNAPSFNAPFNAIEEFRNEYRCIASDLRNANGGQSSGPLEVDRPWDAYSDDQLGLMDHLGIKEFMVMGFCIGGPMIWNLLKRAPKRIVAAVLAQPSGFRPEMPDRFYQNNTKLQLGRRAWVKRRNRECQNRCNGKQRCGTEHRNPNADVVKGEPRRQRSKNPSCARPRLLDTEHRTAGFGGNPVGDRRLCRRRHHPLAQRNQQNGRNEHPPTRGEADQQQPTRGEPEPAPK